MSHAPSRTALILLAVIALAACNREAPRSASSADTSASPEPTAASTPVAPVAKQPPRRITPDEIAKIEASGRTGLWSEVTEVCIGAKPVRTTLTWNVQSSGAERVVVYVVDKGVERNFGQGGPIGLKETGPWLRSGTEFKIRAAGTKEEISNLVIGGKQCQE